MKKSGLEKWIYEFKRHFWRIIFSILFFVVAGVGFYFVGNYADGNGNVSIRDPVLSLIPPIDFFGPVFVIGIFITIGFLLLYSLIFRIKDFAYVFSQFALLVMIRNLFIFLAPFKVASDAVPVTFPWIANHWNFHNDLFFSGHGAIPLIGFFMFKDSKIRWLFLADAILMWAAAIFTHIHYSIDVLIGIFVAYGSYKLGEWMFGKWMRR